MMKDWKRALLVVFILGSCIGCDQVTKDIARESLQYAPAVTFLNSIHFLYTENPGIAFSLGAEIPEPFRRILLIFGTGSLLFGMGIYLFRRCRVSSMYLVGASLVIGGGLGNLIDRILYEGHVIDFILIHLGGVKTAIFNIADVLIITGVILLLFSLVQEKPAGDTVESSS